MTSRELITLATKLTDVINETMNDPTVGILHHDEGVDLIPANLELSAMEFNLVNAMSRETALRNYLSEVKEKYDYKGLKNAEEGKTAPMPKFETSVELLDPMAEVQKESEVEKEKPAENSTDENAALLTKLLSNPETAALLKALAKTI